MQMRKRLAAVTLVLALTAPVYAANIVDTAKAAGVFKMLLRANHAAGTDKALMGKGPFTIFDPNERQPLFLHGLGRKQTVRFWRQTWLGGPSPYNSRTFAFDPLRTSAASILGAGVAIACR